MCLLISRSLPFTETDLTLSRQPVVPLMLVMFVTKVSCLLLSINYTYFSQLQFLGFSGLAFRMFLYNVTHTVHILTVNKSTKNVLNPPH